MDKGLFLMTAVLSIRDEMKGKLSSVTSEWDKLRKAMKAGTDEAKLFDGSFKALKTGGIAMAAGAGLGVVTKDLVNASLEAGKLASNVRSLGVTKEEMEKISASTGGLASEMGILQETFLSGIYDIKSAVSTLDPSQLASVSGAIGTLAVATKGDFEGLGDLFGTTYSQFREMYKNMSDTDFAGLFGNTLSMAVKTYKTDGAKMQQAMESLGASASILGISFEEQSAVLGRLQNTMQPGVAGTSYRAFLTNLDKGMKDLKLSSTDLMTGKMLDMPSLMEQISNKYSGIASASKQAFKDAGNDPLKAAKALESIKALNPSEFAELSKAFGQEGAAAVATLMGKTSELRNEISLLKEGNKDMNWSAMKEMAKINLDSGAAQIDRANASWGAFKTALGSGITEGPLKNIVGSFADILGGVTKFLGEHPKVAKFMGLFVIGLAGVLTLGGAIISLAGIVGMYAAVKKVAWIMETYDALAKGASAVKTGILTGVKWAATTAQSAYNLAVKYGTVEVWAHGLATGAAATKTWLITTAQWAWNAAMSANPIGLIVLGIAALIAIGIVLYKNWDTVKEKLSGFWTSIKTKWNEAPGWVKTLFTILLLPVMPFIAVPLLIIKNWDKIKSFFSGLATSVSQSIKNFSWESLYNSALNAGKKFLDTFLNGIKSKLGGVGDVIKSIGGAVMSWLPQSDAKQGPMSNISKSGRSFVTTWNKGLEDESKNTGVVKNFAEIQSKTLSSESPMVQKLAANTGGGISAKSLIGNLTINIDGKKMTLSEIAELITQTLDYEITKSGVADGII